MSNEQDIRERAKKFESGMAEVYKHIEGLLGHGNESWTMKKLLDYQTGLFTFAKFQVGERVQLAETPDISMKDSWGWMGSKHFLVKGAKAVVRGRDWSGEFKYDLEFDDESWKGDDGVVHPSERKHIFGFSERMVGGLP